MNDYTLYDVTVTLLTPLHIGSGRELLHQYDYAIHRGQTWRIDEDALLDAQQVDDLALADRLAQTPPARLLVAQDFRSDAPFFRYVIRGTPRSGADGAQVREQFKDAFDRPYLPGTSLKGALRTALAWYVWRERGKRPDRTQLGRSPKFAAQRYERDLLGKNPNHDLLRALHVGDSEPVDAERLLLVNARVLHRGGRAASPIELEALRPDTAFHLTLKLDRALFSEWAHRRGLRLREAERLRQLPAVVRSHTDQRLAQEVRWFTGVPGANRIADFYRQLQRARLPDGDFLIQLGWGTGWEGKTLGSHLQKDADFMEGILRSRRDGGYGLTRGRRRRGDPFPKSRRVVMQVSRHPDGRIQERPVAPLGWVRVQMSPHAGKKRSSATVVPSTSTESASPIPPPPQTPVSTPSPAVSPGTYTGTVARFNLKQKRGIIVLDQGQVEIPVRVDQLRKGVYYLAKDARVSLTIVQDETGVHPQDVGPM